MKNNHPSLQKLCQEAIEKQRRKISALVESTGNLNNEELKRNNQYLDQMIIEYMFYFDETSRKNLLKRKKFQELEKFRLKNS